MKILITGASSLLGSEILRQSADDESVQAGLVVHSNRELAIEREDWRRFQGDITDRERILRIVEEFRPEAIIHLSSQGNLDYCDKHPEEAYRVNVEGTKNIVDAASACGARIAFSSTIYVFDGSNPPYSESSTPNPVNLYGQTKLEAESIVLAADPGNAVLRLTTMYGWHSPLQRKNWVTWLLAKLHEGETIPVVTDVYANNVWVGDVAESFLIALTRPFGGVYHVGGSEVANRYDFSVAVAEIFGYPTELLEPVESSHFEGIATRPRDTTCTVQKIRDALRVFPLGVRDGLAEMRAMEETYRRLWERSCVG